MESPSFIETLRKLNPRAKSGFNAAVAQSCIEDCLSIFGMKRFSIEDLPKKYHNFAKKIISAKRQYENGHTNLASYFQNFEEVDARRIGEGMQKLLKNIPNIT